MDDVATKTNKNKVDEKNVEDLLHENKKNMEKIDTSIFDITLREIDRILNTLEKKPAIDQDHSEKPNILPEVKSTISKIYQAKKELLNQENNLIINNNLISRIEALEKIINNSNEHIFQSEELEKETINEFEEHKINKDLLSMEELHNFGENGEKKKRSFFGFYSYLILIIIIFFIFYGTLSVSKNLIIYKYPMTESYILYFYEIIEILKFSIFGFFNFIANKI